LRCVGRDDLTPPIHRLKENSSANVTVKFAGDFPCLIAENMHPLDSAILTGTKSNNGLPLVRTANNVVRLGMVAHALLNASTDPLLHARLVVDLGA
jgi:hypothetical protein